MKLSLLATKIDVPSPPDRLVSRKHLLVKLSQAESYRLFLVSAPAGFGKTTLLSSWVNQQNLPVAWLSLDRADSDPKLFLRYLAASLQSINKRFVEQMPEYLTSYDWIHLEEVISELINNISMTGAPFYLVLDDYHVIDNTKVHDIIEFFITHCPPPMQIIISTRSDPPFPVARLRAKNQIIEIRAKDLNFSDNEAFTFFEQVIQLDLSLDEVETLNSKTEGWIAGLQMAGLSMKGTDSISGFIKAFAGDQRHILDFLTEEVLQAQSESTRTFLLETSILERLCGPICNRLTGRSDSSLKLEQLEKKNLFVIPMDGKRYYFRYHHLFADLLRVQLTQLYPDRIKELHQVASLWYRENGFRSDAISHSLAAEDIDGVLEQIMSTMETMLQRGEIFKDVISWIEALPGRVIQVNPFIQVLYAWLLQIMVRIEEANDQLALTEKNLNAELAAVLDIQIMVIRASLARMTGNPKEAILLSQNVLDIIGENVTEQTISVHTSLAFNLLMVHLYCEGNVHKAEEWSKKLLTLCQSANSTTLILAALALKIVIKSWQCDLSGVLSQASQGLELAEKVAHETGSSVPAVAYMKVGLGELKYEKNDLKASAVLLEEAVNLCKQWEIWDTLCESFTLLAQTKQAQGLFKQALDILSQAESLSHDIQRIPKRTGSFAAMKNLLILREFGLKITEQPIFMNDVRSWFKSQSLTKSFNALSTDEEFSLLVWIRFLIYTNETNGVLDMLKILKKNAAAGGRKRQEMEMTILQALLLSRIDEDKKSMQVLEKAISIAEPCGFIRLFIDEGQLMQDLLEKIDKPNPYVKKLLHDLKTDRVGIPVVKTIDELSARELEVLQYIADGHTNQMISELCYISLNTVKTHVKNIISKLAVSSRTQAVAEARKQGILS